MSPYQKLLQQIEFIEERISYVFQNKELLALAFIHRSFYNEHRTELTNHNERLEFLGDSVLNFLVSHYLYSEFPSLSEGDLSHLRSQLVDASMCSKLLETLSLSEFVLLGRGEQISKGQNKESIQADLFEALLAALFLDGGLDVVKTFFWSHFSEKINHILKEPSRNWKAELQEYAQKKHQRPPVYKILSETGPDHNKRFEVVALVGNMQLKEGGGSSKKEAEQEAAKASLMDLEKGKNE